jgi:uncharacterized protein
MMGLEPTTFCMASRCSSQLSYIRVGASIAAVFGTNPRSARFSAVEFDQHTLVLLVRPPDAPELSEEEALRLQDAHLANQARLGDEGYVIAAGPFTDQEDERLRGLAVLSCDPETARELYASDPAVQAGRLGVEILTWMVPKGNVRFEQVARPRSTRSSGRLS